LKLKGKSAMKNRSEKNSVWQLQEAKAMFCEMVRDSADSPQLITVRGKETAVILSIDEYRSLTEPKQNFVEFIQNSPLYGVELELPERLPEAVREIDL
jgi:prevent-host-death family protein